MDMKSWFEYFSLYKHHITDIYDTVWNYKDINNGNTVIRLH